MGAHVVRVTPIDKYFTITWRLSKRCNNDCMYCPAMWHDDVSKHHTLDELQMYWRDIVAKTKHLGLRYKIAFTGGEATNSKYFVPFVEWLGNEYASEIAQILLTTNGSAPTHHYEKLFKYINNISFSVHSEGIDEQKFFDTIRSLKQSIHSKNHLHVNIMNEFWNVDRIEMYKKLLSDIGVSYSISNVNYDLKTRDYPVFKGRLNLEA